ncbi:MAG: MmgE/PrpD family protein [Thermomicrobiales bacterium]
MTTIAETLARFTAGLDYNRIPGDIVTDAAMLLADTLACAIAAAAEPGPNAIDIVSEQARADQGSAVATVVGTGWKTSLRAATLVNCTMARYLDANDIYMPVAGSLSGSGHFSDALPALVSAAEAFGSTGRELIEAVVVAYEVQASLADAFPWLDRGFHSVSQVTVAVALAVGKLMGLTGLELAHASSLAITAGLFVQSWLHPSTDVPAIKGGAPGLAAERGITCAELAGRGFTGPLDAFESFFAFFGEDLPDPASVFDRLGADWMTPRNAIKSVPAQIYIQPVAQCVGRLYDDGLRLESVSWLRVISNDGACGRVQGAPGAFRPASREAADHSTPFVAVMTFLRRPREPSQLPRWSGNRRGSMMRCRVWN